MFPSIGPQQRFLNFSAYFSGFVLLMTAFAKMTSAGGTARLLQANDPLLAIPFRELLWIVGLIELGVGMVCFLSTCAFLKAILVAWLASNFVIYRICLLGIGYHKPCSCLGNLTDALPVSAQTADMAMKAILTYLLVASYGSIFWLLQQQKKASTITSTR